MGSQVNQVPQQRAVAPGRPDAEELIDRLSRDLERAISFAEECRWHFPELSREAEQLTAEALALFGKTMRSMRASEAADH